MFVLVVVEDKIKVQPDQFDQDLLTVLEDQIEIKYVNKVLPDSGLCISLYDFVEIGDPYIYPAEGSSHQQVKFRLVVFKPFLGEVIVGNIIESNSNRIRVSLGFFHDIIIPSNHMQNPCIFDTKTQLWSWKYSDTEDGSVLNFELILGAEVLL